MKKYWAKIIPPGLFFVLFALDLWLKWRVGSEHRFFVKNFGISFGLFPNSFLASFVYHVFLLVVSFFSLRRLVNCSGFWVTIAFTFFLAGAAGNLADRIRQGYVLDYLHWRIWPGFSFNLSDVYVGLGLWGLVVSGFF